VLIGVNFKQVSPVFEIAQGQFKRFAVQFGYTIAINRRNRFQQSIGGN